MVQIQESVEAAGQKNPQAEQDAAVKASLQKIKHKFMVMSGKGGVGKTSTYGGAPSNLLQSDSLSRMWNGAKLII